jgi:hypothetical protein
MNVPNSSIPIISIAASTWPRCAKFAMIPEENMVRVATLEERVKNYIRFFWVTISVGFAWLAGISWMLYQMNGKLSELGAPQRLLQVATQPEKKENQAAAKELIASARKKSIPISPEIIGSVGKSFIGAAQKAPDAWGVALDLLSYRSSEFRIQATGIPLPADHIVLHYNVGPLVPGKPAPHIERLTRAFVASNEAARYESIGENLNKEGGAPGLSVRGGAVNLDGKDIRNVMFVEVEIHYSGKPLILENVAFMNCKFVFENTEPSRKLSESILAARETVSFRTGA